MKSTKNRALFQLAQSIVQASSLSASTSATPPAAASHSASQRKRNHTIVIKDPQQQQQQHDSARAREAETQIQALNQRNLELTQKLAVQDLRVQSLEEDLARERGHRLRLLTTILNQRGPAVVMCRIRPRTQSEVVAGAPQLPIEKTDDGQLRIVRREKTAQGSFRESLLTFAHAYSFFPSASDSDMWDELEPTVRGVLDGVRPRCAIVAYGQTGSGKTYAIKELRSRIATAIWQQLGDDEADGSASRANTVTVTVSCVELYIKDVQDLLAAPANTRKDERCQQKLAGLRRAPRKQGEDVFPSGGELFVVTNPAELSTVFDVADQRRTQRATKANSQSSRSSAIYTMRIDGITSSSSPSSFSPGGRPGYLTLVDLAGSERADETGMNDGQARAEAVQINLGLSTFQQVITALVHNHRHSHSRGQNTKKKKHQQLVPVPYRQHPLTELLKPVLAQGIILMLALSPLKASEEQTIATLKFGNRCQDFD